MALLRALMLQKHHQDLLGCLALPTVEHAQLLAVLYTCVWYTQVARGAAARPTVRYSHKLPNNQQISPGHSRHANFILLQWQPVLLHEYK